MAVVLLFVFHKYAPNGGLFELLRLGLELSTMEFWGDSVLIPHGTPYHPWYRVSLADESR